ncbi:hypothetical protein ACNO8X_22755 [Mycobacterium sp. PDNC021]|uniref:hypothetical protein n=1 Tax=Mycobacterium sp. PDNC021 TaxID=3391399 RepID=UPI003AAF63D5
MVLGVGEFDSAIQAAMTIVERERLTLPVNLIERLSTWCALRHPDGPASERVARPDQFVALVVSLSRRTLASVGVLPAVRGAVR